MAYAGDYGEYAHSSSTKMLLCRYCSPPSTKVLELLEGMRRILEAVANCALYAVSTADDARCVLKVVEVVVYILEVMNRVRCVLESCSACCSVCCSACCSVFWRPWRC